MYIKCDPIYIIMIQQRNQFFFFFSFSYFLQIDHDLLVFIVFYAGISKGNQMRIVPVFFIAALWLATIGDARYVIHNDDDSSISNEQLKVTSMQPSPSKDITIIKSKSLRRRRLGEKSRSFVDLLPYVGSFIFRGVVRRVNHNFINYPHIS